MELSGADVSTYSYKSKHVRTFTCDVIVLWNFPHAMSHIPSVHVKLLSVSRVRALRKKTRYLPRLVALSDGSSDDSVVQDKIR